MNVLAAKAEGWVALSSVITLPIKKAHMRDDPRLKDKRSWGCFSGL